MEYKETFIHDRRIHSRPAAGLTMYIDSWKYDKVEIKLRNPSNGEIYNDNGMISLIIFSDKVKNVEVIVSGEENKNNLRDIAESVGGYFSSEQARMNREKVLGKIECN